MKKRMITKTNANFSLQVLAQNAKLEITYSPKIHICIQSTYHPHIYIDFIAEVHIMFMGRNTVTKLHAASLED